MTVTKIFDMFDIQAKKTPPIESTKPGFDDPGFEKTDVVDDDNPTISVPNILHKGTDMSSPQTNEKFCGFVQFPRHILQDPRWKGAPLRYQKVFMILCENAIWGKSKEHSVGSSIINVEPGQFCCTVRQVADLCNEGVTFQDDKVDKNLVHRAMTFWNKCHFMGQEVRQHMGQQKTLVTIYHLTTYEIQKNKSGTGSETTSETGSGQGRDSKEEDIKKKKKKKRESTSSSPPTPAPSILIDREMHISTTQEEHDKMVTEFGADRTAKAYVLFSEWKQNTPKSKWKKSDYLSMRKWVFNAVDERDKKAGSAAPKVDDNKIESIESNRHLCEGVARKIHGKDRLCRKTHELLEVSNAHGDKMVRIYFNSPDVRGQIQKIYEIFGV